MDFGWLPSLAIYITGIAIIGLSFKNFLKKTSPNKDNIETLLQEEHEALFTRSKELPKEEFIQVEFSKYPTVSHIECQKEYQQLMSYKDVPLINLRDKSNLELKKTYGVQTLEQIGQYEKNYFGFMNSAIEYGKILYENGYLNEARQTLEQCLLYHCDISKCYVLLIEIYKEQSDQEALSHLKSIIQEEMGNSPFLHKVLKQLQVI